MLAVWLLLASPSGTSTAHTSLPQRPHSLPEIEPYIRGLKDPDQGIRHDCVYYIGQIELGPEARIATLPHLRRCLRDSYFWVRKCAVIASVTHRDAGAVVGLRRMIREDPEQELREFAVAEVGLLGPIGESAGPELVEVLLTSNEVTVRGAAALSLASQEQPGFRRLRAVWEDRAFPVEVRQTAIAPYVLTPGDYSVMRPFVGAFVQALNDEDLAGSAADILAPIASLGIPEAVTPLERLAHSTPSYTSVASARALSRIDPGNRYALAGLLYGLKSDDTEVRSNAARYLGYVRPFPAQSGIPALLRAFADADYPVSVAAQDALIQLGPIASSAVPAMRRFAEDKMSPKRQLACAVLRAIDSTPK
jgi:HEAT repeat protein